MKNLILVSLLMMNCFLIIGCASSNGERHPDSITDNDEQTTKEESLVPKHFQGRANSL